MAKKKAKKTKKAKQPSPNKRLLQAINRLDEIEIRIGLIENHIGLKPADPPTPPPEPTQDAQPPTTPPAAG